MYSKSAEGIRPGVFVSGQQAAVKRTPADSLSKDLRKRRLTAAFWFMPKRFEFSKQEWADLCNVFGWRCARCNRPDTPDNPISADHIIPYSKGGHGRITNIQPLCRSCNTGKRDRSSDDFRLWPWAMNIEYYKRLRSPKYFLGLIRKLLPYFETIPNPDDWAWLWRLTPKQTEILKREIADRQGVGR